MTLFEEEKELIIEESIEPEVEQEATHVEELTDEEALKLELDGMLARMDGNELTADETEEEAPSEEEARELESDVLPTEQPENEEPEEAQVSPEEKLEAFKKEYVKEDAVPALLSDEEAQLNKLADELRQDAARLQQDHLKGLPNHAYTGADKSLRGKTIYDLNPEQLNDYLVDLRDNNQELEAGYVQAAYFEARNRVASLQQGVAQYNQKYEAYNEAYHTHEWNTVGEELTGKLPGFNTAHKEQVAAYLRNKAVNTPGFVDAVVSKEGKVKAAVEAILQLGILESLQKELVQAAPPVKEKKPSAPDARTVSKRVSNTVYGTGENAISANDIANMSTEEFSKLDPKVRDAALAEEFARMLR